MKKKLLSYSSMWLVSLGISGWTLSFLVSSGDSIKILSTIFSLFYIILSVWILGNGFKFYNFLIENGLNIISQEKKLRRCLTLSFVYSLIFVVVALIQLCIENFDIANKFWKSLFEFFFAFSWGMFETFVFFTVKEYRKKFKSYID